MFLLIPNAAELSTLVAEIKTLLLRLGHTQRHLHQNVRRQRELESHNHCFLILKNYTLLHTRVYQHLFNIAFFKPTLLFTYIFILSCTIHFCALFFTYFSVDVFLLCVSSTTASCLFSLCVVPTLKLTLLFVFHSLVGKDTWPFCYLDWSGLIGKCSSWSLRRNIKKSWLEELLIKKWKRRQWFPSHVDSDFHFV